MGVTWTEEQKKVIELRNRNILVSAAAGSGKTAVLVERIITMLTDIENPVDVDRLLVVTFTEAAAAEMKDRIRNAIEKKLLEQPENEHLKQQATLIHNAQITTIHSFCLSVIRDHFHAIDLDPAFRIGEEGELMLLKREVLGELLEERYASEDQKFLEFAMAYGGKRSDKNIEELVLKIYEYSRSYPDANGWLALCLKAYEPNTVEELEKSQHIQFVINNVKNYLEDISAMAKYALALCREPDGPKAYESVVENDLQLLKEIIQEDTFAGLYKRMIKVPWKRLTVNKDKTVSEDKIQAVKKIRDEVKGTVKKLSELYFYQNIEEALEDIVLCRSSAEVMVELVCDFAKRFEEKKRMKTMIDFSDMEQYALRILTEETEEGLKPSVIASEYQQHFQEIMIDEYQDSNMIQETILTSVSRISRGEHNVFMVGDVKQSIYRFRLSRPELFMEKFNTYSLEDSKTQRIDLHKNFRSRREVLESANFIFEQIMTKKLGGISYDENAALYVGADYKEGENLETEVFVIEKNMDGWKEEHGNAISERELEARAIAGQIRKLMKTQKVIDKKTGELRDIRYSDIVILIRSIRGFADVFTEVLNREGIPAYAGTREGYFSAQEIGIILSYLRVLDNRRQDIPLAAVLTSPIGGLTEKEAAQIRSGYKEVPFHEAVVQYHELGENEIVKEKLGRCLGMMDELREKVPYTPMHELLYIILEKTGYRDYISAMPGGEQRKANLDMLIEKARIFESTSYKGLFHFVRYIEELQKYNVDYGEANVEDELSDLVRIMTIHKSKGLEFPVVFVAGMGKQFNMQDARSEVAIHPKLGIGLNAVNLETRVKSPSIVKKVIQKEEMLDSLAEELRVLYVALTRAKEKLIISGTLKNVEKAWEEASVLSGQQDKGLSFERLSRASTYLDWIIPALIRLNENVPILVRSINVEDIVREEVIEEAEQRITEMLLDNLDENYIYNKNVKDMLEEQLSYEYPYKNSQIRKLKFTVSELKKKAYELDEEEQAEAGEIVYEEPESVPLLPKFMHAEEEFTGAIRGTAYHRIMELLDFTRDYSEAELKEAKEQLISEGKIEKEAAACVKIQDIQRFLESKAGKRMQDAARNGRLRKEQPFVLGLDIYEVEPSADESEWILVQGIIDAYFEEEDGLIVLDYKTDRVHRMEELREKYKAQLDYYAKALERATGKTVKEKIIYSFTLQKELAV